MLPLCHRARRPDEIYWTLCLNQTAGNVERMEAVDRIKGAAGLVVAAIRHPMAGDTKRADQHWKLTGSPLARFLMMTGRSVDTFGILVFDNSPNQRAGIQMIGL